MVVLKKEKILFSFIFDYLDDEPTAQSCASESNVHVNELFLQQLVDMGFSREGCKRALINTGNNNIEAAMNWVFEHQADPDFDTAYQAPSKKARVDAAHISTVS
jgi:ubiquitin carboxyl-terminal hydrolase 5/13